MIPPRLYTGTASQRWLLLAAMAAAIATAIASLGIGATGIGFGGWLRLLDGAAPATEQVRLILLEIRLPRTVLGVLAGASLAVAGAIMQGLFRNPLADPALIGVSPGAALGVVCVIVLGEGALAPVVNMLGPWAHQVAALVGGLTATALLYGISTRDGTTSVATLLLAGLALAAFTAAATGLLVHSANDRQLRDMTFWSLGSLSGANWRGIGAALPFFALPFVLLPMLARPLNALLLGEAEAWHLGVEVERMKRLAMLAVACAAATAVSLTGVIGFVGVVVPHLVRLVAGPDHRLLLPASALLGAALLVGADVLARLIVAPAELPIGIVTALIGAPVFLRLLLRTRPEAS